MNSYTHNIATTVLRLVFTGLILLSPVYAWSLELETVFENTAVVPPARVGFREQRHNPMLKEPIVLTGYLEYLKPGHLLKVIETPYEETFLIADDHIEITQDGKSRRLPLSKSKPIQAMLGGIEAILAGQANRLGSMFRYELTGTECAWSLRLEPKSGRIAAHLTAMIVKGDENAVTSMRIELEEGEWSLMEILSTDP